ncbi:hypothetical protein WAI453_003783 [Rhynchosporium graminicola]
MSASDLHNIVPRAGTDRTSILEWDGENLLERTGSVFVTKPQICRGFKKNQKSNGFSDLPTELKLVILKYALPNPRVLSLEYNAERNRGASDDEGFSDDENASDNESASDDESDSETEDLEDFNPEGFHLQPCSPGTEQILNYRLICRMAEEIFQENYSKLEPEILTSKESELSAIDSWLASTITDDSYGAVPQTRQYIDRKRDTLLLLGDTGYNPHREKSILWFMAENKVNFPGVANIVVYLDNFYWRYSPLGFNTVLRNLASARSLKNIKIASSGYVPATNILDDVYFLDTSLETRQILQMADVTLGRVESEQPDDSYRLWGFDSTSEATRLAKDLRYESNADDSLWAAIRVEYCIAVNLRTARIRQFGPPQIPEEVLIISHRLESFCGRCMVPCSYDGSLPTYDTYYRLDSVFTEDWPLGR